MHGLVNTPFCWQKTTLNFHANTSPPLAAVPTSAPITRQLLYLRSSHMFCAFHSFKSILEFLVKEATLSEQITHSTVDLHLKEISEFLHSSVMNKDFTLPNTHKIQPLRIWPIGPIASESVPCQKCTFPAFSYYTSREWYLLSQQ